MKSASRWAGGRKSSWSAPSLSLGQHHVLSARSFIWLSRLAWMLNFKNKMKKIFVWKIFCIASVAPTINNVPPLSHLIRQIPLSSRYLSLSFLDPHASFYTLHRCFRVAWLPFHSIVPCLTLKVEGCCRRGTSMSTFTSIFLLLSLACSLEKGWWCLWSLHTQTLFYHQQCPCSWWMPIGLLTAPRSGEDRS